MPTLVLHPSRSATRRLLVAALAACTSTASAAPPLRRAFDECVRVREAGKPREALAYCRAAYDALALDLADAALHDRSLIVWETYYTYRDAQAAALDPALLCEEAAFLRGYLDFLDTHLSPDTRPADRRDASRLVQETEAALGTSGCEPADDLLPVSTTVQRPSPPPVPAPPPPTPPAPDARPLRLSGGVLLGVGVLFASTTAVPLAFGEALQREHDRILHGGYPMGHVSEDIISADAQLAATGARLNQIALGLAIVAGAALLSGIVLLAVDSRHRGARVALRPRARVAGIRFALEF